MSSAQATLLRHLHHLAGGDATLSDRELLHRFTTKHDEAAFAALVRRHGPMVLQVCRRALGRTQDVEDAFQATFLVLLRKAASNFWRENVGGWLHGVAVRVALRSRSHTARSTATAQPIETSVADDPLDQLTARELLSAFDEELARLPAGYRDPLILFHLQGKTQEETARALKCSLSSVRRRLEQGRKRLHVRLTRRGLELPAAFGIVLLSRDTLPAALPVPAGISAFSTRASALADGILKAAWTPLKTTAVFILTLGVLVGGAGLAAQHFLAVKPAEPGEEQPTSAAKSERNDGDKTARTDLYGDPLPPGALVRMGTVRFRHHSFLGNVAFSLDGKILAAGGYGGSILLFDAATGRKLREFQAFASQFAALAFAPDGKTLASAGSKRIQIWDVATARELRRFDAEVTDDYSHHFIVPLVFSADGAKLASVAPDHSVRVWSVRTGKELVQLRGHEYLVRCLAFSADGETLFSASGDSTRGGSVRAWAVASGKELRRFSLHRSRASSQPEPLCFSPDAKTFVCAAHQYLPPKKGAKAFINAYVVTFLDLDTGEIVRTLEPREGRFKSAAFSADGKLLATMNGVETIVGNLRSEDNNRLQVWETATGKQLVDCAAYAEHFGQWPTCLAFSPDGKKVAAAATSSALHIWDVGRGHEDPERPATHHDEIACLAYSPDGRTLASGSADHAIVLWDAATGEQRLRLLGHEGIVSALAFSPDGKLLASASRFHDQTIRLWNLTAAREIRQFVVPNVESSYGMSTSVNTCIAFAAGGKVLALGGTDRRLRLWDVASGKMLFDRIARGLPPPVKFNPTAPHDWAKEVKNVNFTTDGRVMALSTGKTMRVVDVAAGQQLFQFAKDDITTAHLALSPDGKTLACGGPGPMFRLVEVASGKDVLKADLRDAAVQAVAFAADGRTIAVSAGHIHGSIHLLDVPTGQTLLRLRGHYCRVNSLAFSPDGTKLASGRMDSTALVWDVSAARRKLAIRKLTPRELDRLWADLRDKDAMKAHAALWMLVAAPEVSVAFLKERLQPVPRMSSERLRRWIADLDAEDFTRREDASRELAKLGSEAEPALRQVLQDKPSLETRRRAEALLSSLSCQTETTPDALRQVRAIQVLEQIGSPEVPAILKALAPGAPAAPATRDAAAALGRLTSANSQRKHE